MIKRCRVVLACYYSTCRRYVGLGVKVVMSQTLNRSDEVLNRTPHHRLEEHAFPTYDDPITFWSFPYGTPYGDIKNAARRTIILPRPNFCFRRNMFGKVLIVESYFYARQRDDDFRRCRSADANETYVCLQCWIDQPQIRRQTEKHLEKLNYYENYFYYVNEKRSAFLSRFWSKNRPIKKVEKSAKKSIFRDFGENTISRKSHRYRLSGTPL